RAGSRAAHPGLAGRERPVPLGRRPAGGPGDRREAAGRHPGEGAGVKDLRMSVLALVLWVAALACIHLPALALAGAALCLLTGSAVAVLARWRRKPRSGGVIVLALLCCAGAGASTAAAQPLRDALAESDGRAV